MVKDLKNLHILTNNRESSKRLKELGFSFKRVHYVDNGIKITPFNRDYIKKETLSIVMLGRYVHTKRFDILTSAIKVLYDKGYNLRVRYIGEGAFKSKIQDDINSNNLNKVIKLNSFKNLSQLDNFDIGLLITDTEGFPNIILEYGLKKIPIIMSNFLVMNTLSMIWNMH